MSVSGPGSAGAAYAARYANNPAALEQERKALLQEMNSQANPYDTMVRTTPNFTANEAKELLTKDRIANNSAYVDIDKGEYRDKSNGKTYMRSDARDAMVFNKFLSPESLKETVKLREEATAAKEAFAKAYSAAWDDGRRDPTENQTLERLQLAQQLAEAKAKAAELNVEMGLEKRAAAKDGVVDDSEHDKIVLGTMQKLGDMKSTVYELQNRVDEQPNIVPNKPQ